MGCNGIEWEFVLGYTGEDTLILRKPYMQREKFMAKVNSEHMGCNAFLCSLFRCLKQFGRQLRDVRFMFTKKNCSRKVGPVQVRTASKCRQLSDVTKFLKQRPPYHHMIVHLIASPKSHMTILDHPHIHPAELWQFNPGTLLKCF